MHKVFRKEPCFISNHKSAMCGTMIAPLGLFNKHMQINTEQAPS